MTDITCADCGAAYQPGHRCNPYDNPRIGELERELATEKAERRKAEDALVPSADLANTWAREIGVEEALDQFGMQDLIDRLWSKASRQRAKAEEAIRIQVDGNAVLITRVIDAERERDNMRVVMETAENESRQHAKRVEQLYMERDEVAAALDELKQMTWVTIRTPAECPQWRDADWTKAVCDLRHIADKCVTNAKAILAAHDAALVKPLVEALRTITRLSIQADTTWQELWAAIEIAAAALAAHKPCPTCNGKRETRERQPYPDESTVIVSVCPNCAGGKKGV